MQRASSLWMWLLVVSIHHPAIARVTGLTIERASVNGIVSADSADREVDISLNFVGESPLPTTSTYPEAFTSTTSSTTSPSAVQPNLARTDGDSDESIAGKNRRQSTDAFVDNILGAYKRVLDRTGRRLLECENHGTLPAAAVCAPWARQVVNSALRSTEPPPTRKTLVKYIVKNFLSEESMLAQGNSWFERLEDVLCNCYNVIVRTVADDTRCHECRSIPDDVVFTFLVEDLLTDVLASQHETYITDAVGRLQEVSGISNRKRSVWEALMTTKQDMESKKKVLVEDKKRLKEILLSAKPLVADVWGDTLIAGGEKATWKLSPSQFANKGIDKRSAPSNYEGAHGKHAMRETELSPSEILHDYYEVLYNESGGFENNWRRVSLDTNHDELERGHGSHDKRPFLDESISILEVELEGTLGSRDMRRLLDESISLSEVEPRQFAFHHAKSSSANYSGMAVASSAISDDEKVDGRLLKRTKKNYYPPLEQKNAEFVQTVPEKIKMFQGHRTGVGGDVSLSSSQETDEENKNENPQKESDSRNAHAGSYSDSVWSQFLNALGRWTQFPEKGRVGSILGSNTTTARGNMTNSSSESKLTWSQGSQRTGTSVRTSEPAWKPSRRAREAVAREKARVLMGLIADVMDAATGPSGQDGAAVAHSLFKNADDVSEEEAEKVAGLLRQLLASGADLLRALGIRS